MSQPSVRPDQASSRPLGFILDNQTMRDKFGAEQLEKAYFSSTSRDAWVKHANPPPLSDAAGVRHALKFEPTWNRERARNGPTEVTYTEMYPAYPKEFFLSKDPSFKPHIVHVPTKTKVPDSDYTTHFKVHPLAVREAIKWDKNASALFGQSPMAFGYDNSTYGRGYVKHDLHMNPRQQPCRPFDLGRQEQKASPRLQMLPTTYQAFCGSTSSQQYTPRGPSGFDGGRKPSNTWVNHVLENLNDFGGITDDVVADRAAWGKHMAALPLPPVADRLK